MLRRTAKAVQVAVPGGEPAYLPAADVGVREPGETPPLKPGFVGLYRALKMPLVPVAIDSGTAWPKFGAKHPGVIRFAFQPAIAPGLHRREIEPLVHTAINLLNCVPPRNPAE